MSFKKLLCCIIGIVLLLGALYLSYHAYQNKQEQIKAGDAIGFKQTLSYAYSAYSFSSMKLAVEKARPYAEKLYQKEKTEGKTKKEFKGFTALGYYIDALDEYEDQIGEQYKLAIYLPVLLVVLIIVALIISIRFGLSAMRPLSFENKATVFNK